MQKTYNKTQLQVKEACVNKKTLKTFKYLNDVRRCSSIVKKMSLTSDCVYKWALHRKSTSNTSLFVHGE